MIFLAGIHGVGKDAFSKVFGRKNKSGKVETSLIEQFWYPKYGPRSTLGNFS